MYTSEKIPRYADLWSAKKCFNWKCFNLIFLQKAFYLKKQPEEII
jgi:hypothetical protein